MIDITGLSNGVQFADTVVYKAENILRIQTDYLLYEQDFGIDINYFLNAGFEIAMEVFENYAQQRLAEYGISVIEVKKQFEDFRNRVEMKLLDTNEQTQMIGG
ncbi:MAG: hypothetical protein LBD46_06560 [Endomicrobium sp.]|jgi:hypothetical protein|nr:hypothetical protein [Endomicrobium sp.]